MPPAVPPRLAIEMAEKYLASEAAWAVNPRYQFRTGNAFVYAERWAPADDSEQSDRDKSVPEIADELNVETVM